MSGRVLSDLLAERRILVSAGPGGVGKTTVAAAIGAVAARSGRRTLVATIDPAPRLADALGLPLLGDAPTRLSAEANRILEVPEGMLWAARIDTVHAFRRLVEAQVPETEMRRRIFDNPIYRQITTTLTGSQEYAATLALFDFFNSGAFDLIVLDTPPTANALDFLDAPRRIAEAVSSPAVSWFARSREAHGRFSLRRLRAGGALVLSRVGRLVGSRFLDDLGIFLADFQGVLGGFLERAQAVEALLRRPEVGFLLVLAPEHPAVSEALYFFDRLSRAGLALDAFVANRVLPAPALADLAELRFHLQKQPQLRHWPSEEREAAIDLFGGAAAYLARTARSQRRELDRLADKAPQVPVLKVPLLAHEASSLGALRAIGEHLAGRPEPAANFVSDVAP
jgi:anion-transporting  ArsA/GET3 family ATPase